MGNNGSLKKNKVCSITLQDLTTAVTIHPVGDMNVSQPI